MCRESAQSVICRLRPSSNRGGHLRHVDVGGDPELVRFNSVIVVAQSVTQTNHLGPWDVGKGDAGHVGEGFGSVADDLQATFQGTA